jgi:hypothetical protein
MAFPRGRSQVQGVPMTAPGPSDVQDGDGPGVSQARDKLGTSLSLGGGGGKPHPGGLSLGTGQGWSVTGWGVAVPVRTCHGRSEGWHVPRTMHIDSPSDGLSLGLSPSLSPACSLLAVSHTPQPAPSPPLANPPSPADDAGAASIHGPAASTAGRYMVCQSILLRCLVLSLGVGQRKSWGQWGQARDKQGTRQGTLYYSCCSCSCRYC